MQDLPTEDHVVGGRRARLQVLLYDGPRLLRDGEEVPLSATSRRLLGHLALYGPALRTALAGCLWPDSAQDHALASLRTSVWRLRGAEPALLESDRTRIGLAEGVEVDVDQLRRLAARRGAPGAADEHAIAVARASRGELLPGWEDEGVVSQRERLRQLRLHLLEEASSRLLRAGRTTAALELALEAVAADPLRESAHAALIAVLLAQGNAVEALRVFESFCRRAVDEIGVEPSPHLRRLVQQVCVGAELEHLA